MIFHEADIETFANVTGGDYTRVSGLSRVMSRFHITLARRPNAEATTYIIRHSPHELRFRAKS